MKINKSLSIALIALFSCNPISERKQPPPSLTQLASADLNLDGEQLANAYCASCHVKPEPEVLDKTTWKDKVLPDMRKRMGLVIDEDFGTLMPIDMDVPKGIYSEVPLIKRKDWDKILDYYLANSPEQPLPQEQKIPVKKGIPGFELRQPKFDKDYTNLVTMLQIEPNSGDLWLGHRFKSVFVFDSKNGFELKDSIPTDTAPIELKWLENGQDFELLTMGLMDPSNDSVGALVQYHKINEAWETSSVLSDLKRPVHLASEDFNGDGIEDLVVSEFGNHVGELSLYLSDGDVFKKQVLKAKPGARRVIIEDLDTDGDLDVLALMTQENEGFFAYLNQGDGSFKEKIILRFQPAFGSSDFRYEDMNADGLKDLVLVNGDNADLSQILKNFHGVRIFLNEGDFEFNQSWFYPMYGASGLEVDDFDQDGDVDLMAISFFPDPEQVPRQDLIYFEQSVNGEFLPFVPEIDFNSHWLTITKGDLDLDGDQDVVVGSFEFQDLYQKVNHPWNPIIVLENTKE